MLQSPVFNKTEVSSSCLTSVFLSFLLSAVQKDVFLFPPLSASFSVLSTHKTRDCDCPHRDQSSEFKLIMDFEITRFEFISLAFRL